MLGMLFILANGGKINSLEVARTHRYLNASDVSVQRGKSFKLQLLESYLNRGRILRQAWCGCCTEQQLPAKF